MKILTVILFLMLSLSLTRLFFGKNSIGDYFNLKSSIAKKLEFNEALENENNLLQEEILDLKSGKDAIEERARNELGMIKTGETFYRILNIDTIENEK